MLRCSWVYIDEVYENRNNKNNFVHIRLYAAVDAVNHEIFLQSMEENSDTKS